MSAIHYKFSSSNEYKNVTFDGLNLSLHDLKKLIMEKQKLKSTELDLHITNAQTLQVYKDESILIPKNTAVLVRRIPLGPIRDSKVYIVKRNETAISTASVPTKTQQENDSTPKLSLEELKKTSNLAEANASEEDKIKAAIAQSTNEYDPSNFIKPPRYGSYKYNTSSTLPASQIRCYRCNMQGHYSSQCPMPKGELVKQHHHATGIPRSHMIEVNRDSKGAMLTADGKYVVPMMDKKGYDVGKKERPPFLPAPPSSQDDDEEEPIPDELICLLCKDLLVDAVVIPCCGNSYCDECIRNALLESENHQCPTCHKSNISPDSLIANKFLRQAVNKFRNDTGIAKKRSNAPVWPRPAPSEVSKVVTPVQPAKISYGPPRSTPISVNNSVGGGAYIVKASSDQVVAPKAYTVAKRTPETGGGSPRDPNQPIRIKIGKADKPDVTGSSQSTPSEIKTQVAPADSSVQSSTPSDSYTFNSTPDSNEQKPKITVAEPLPPGISPPTAKVVRPLVDESSTANETQESRDLSGIQPLVDSSSALEDDSTKDLDIISVPVDSQVVESEVQEEKQNIQENNDTQTPEEVNENSEAQEDVLIDELPPPGVSPTKQQPSNVDVPPPGVDPPIEMSQNSQSELEVSEISSSDVDMNTFQPPVVKETTVIQSMTVRPSFPPNIMPTLPPSNPSVPPPSLPIQQPVPASVAASHLPRHVIPGLLPGMPPIPPTVSGTGVPVFQHPPPPFPPIMFPPVPVRPGQFTQPPPGFPAVPHPTALPPPTAAMAIPSLAKSTAAAALPPPPGVETAPIPTINSTASSDRHTSRHGHYSPHKSERSPRKRSDRHGHKSKLDIMSDEFAEKNKKRPERRRRDKSRSRSYSSSSSSSSSSSYSSSSYTSSRSSSSFSSSASSWSNSSYSRSRSPSPRKKRRAKRPKRRSSKTRRKRSSSWSDRSNSREKIRGSKRKETRKRRERTPPKRRKRDNRSYSPSPRRRSNRDRDYQRSPHRGRRAPTPPPKHVDNSPAHPQIPVISRNHHRGIPGLPSKEEADFERDQALYAHFRQAYERDWYERGIRPPPPYDRFIQSRVSKSPSPPGTGIHPRPPPVTSSFPPAYPFPLVQQSHPHIQGPPLPSLMDLRVAPPVSAPGLPLGLPSQPPPRHPHWEEKRYPSHSRPEHNHRDFPPHSRGPGYSDYPSRSRHDDYDSKEERYRMQLSPHSRRRYDLDHPPRDRRYRDERYGAQARRGYDDYQARKRAREQQREVSPRESQIRSKRSRQSPEVQDDGDATPVRDERPPPEERHLEKPVTTRRAGDVSKVGKKPRRERKTDSDHSRTKRSVSPSRRDSKLSTSRSSRSESKSSKRRAETRDSSKSESRSRKAERERSSDTPEAKSRKEESKSDRKDSKSNKKGTKIEKRKRADETKCEEKSEIKKENEEIERRALLDDVAEEKVSEADVPKVVKVEAKTIASEEQDEMKPEPSVIELVPEKTEAEKSVPSDSDMLILDTAVDYSPATTKEVILKEKPAAASPAKTEADSNLKQSEEKDKSVSEKTKQKKEKSGKVKLLRKGLATDQVRKGSPKITKVKKSEADKKKTEETASEKALKLVEYDGTGPPPAGNELVKITIPKSKWEESDDEGKSKTASAVEQKKEDVTAASRKIVKATDAKPVKGRRIRIKRKSPPAAAPPEEATRKIQKSTETPKSVVQSAVKKVAPPVKEPISDARMVITLRRNSKNQEERRRRVSMGNPDEARFEPDYDDESSPEEDMERGRKPKSVALHRNESQDSRLRDEDPDALALSDYSDFSNDEQEKLKKKKKKKKKKHKHRPQISDVGEDEPRSKRSHDQSDDELSADERRHHRHRGSKDRKRHRKGSSGEEKLRKKEKKKRRDSGRERGRYHDEALQSRASRRDESRYDSRERSEVSRDKKRRKEKKQRHRHRRDSISNASDVET